MSAAQTPENPVHEVRNGQECHYFKRKVQPGFQTVWICDCGEVRDSRGYPIFDDR